MTRSDPVSVPAAHRGISPSTASRQAPDTVGFRSSGQSPGRTPRDVPPTLHLVGPGEVGRAFLQRVAELRVRVVAVTDSTATVYDREGLDANALAAHKAAGRPLSSLPRAETIPTELAIELVSADVVVDSTPSSPSGTQAAVQRGRAALRSGAFLALCGKNALAAAVPEWLLGAHRTHLGIDGVLGGTGRQLLRELAELREQCDAVALVGNVTTTVVVQAIEQGASVDEGIAHARGLGLLEPDPTLDLDGSDAATKLAVVWGAVFGESWRSSPEASRIERQDLRTLDPELLRARARRGSTTRLVARGSRNGGDLCVRFEELPAGSPLAAPPDRVVYAYELAAGRRVHTGLAVGYERTAAALLGDVREALVALEVSR